MYKSNPTLSICIGTYNRKEILYKLLLSILRYEGDDIEVIVVDNASTDQTFEMLQNIDDHRLKIHKNEENKGGAYNVLKSIDLSRGKYALYCNDRDFLYVDKLKGLIDFLKVNEYSIVYTKEKNIKKRVISNIIDLFTTSITLHPTGIIYNRRLALEKNIEIMDFLKYKEGVYLWCFFSRELKLYEDAYIYPFAIWREATYTFKKESKSNFDKIEIDELFFMPKGILKQLQTLILQLSEFKNKGALSEKEFYTILYKYIGKHYNKIIYGNWTFCSNPAECAHYNMKPDKFSVRKYLSYHKNYINNCRNILKQFPTKYRFHRYYIFSTSIIITWVKLMLFNIKRFIKRIIKYEKH